MENVTATLNEGVRIFSSAIDVKKKDVKAEPLDVVLPIFFGFANEIQNFTIVISRYKQKQFSDCSSTDIKTKYRKLLVSCCKYRQCLLFLQL